MRLHGADPTLGVEMASTGEVACLGKSFSDAFLKGLIASGVTLPKPEDTVLITVGREKSEIIPSANKLKKLRFSIYSTEHTGQFLERYGIPNKKLHKVSESRKPNISDYLTNKKINLVINIPTVKQSIKKSEKILGDEYKIRRLATEFGIPIFTNFEVSNAFVNAVSRNYDFSIKSLNEFQEGL